MDAVGVTEQPWEPKPLYRRRRVRRRERVRQGPPGRGHRPRQGRARGQARRAEGRGEGAPGIACWATTLAARAAEFGPGVEAAAEEGHAQARDRRGHPPGRPHGHRHPAALGRGRRAEAGARLGDLQPRRHAGAERHDAGHAADDADDRHARPGGHQALHAPLQLPAVLHGRDGPRRFAASPRDRPRRARRAGADAGGPERGGVPVRAAPGVATCSSSNGSTSMAVGLRLDAVA